MSKKWFLLLWAAAMLSPVAWISQQWPETQALFNRIFAPEWMHVITHGILYSVLSITLYLMFPSARSNWRVLLMLFVFLTVFAILQEGIQVFAIGASLSNEEWFDLRIDLISSIASIILIDMFLRARSQTPAGQTIN